ncbi:hypothetical protein P4K23_28730 [Bacillus cereus]|uniref:VirB4 family type IV secretion system protein n=1 Tax=Bacillus toyonensis TaxID=155322 RepID=UPI000BFC621D|nr:hypothetical protein [Bacillus toyonensis]MCU5081055.1 hypothetical protein [Bacillus cereus]MEB9857298.1 hypothetical protein [Bacillus cereus]MEB9891982.1 hypothetical protein [Bacillus cereus]PHA86173.1 hypothetical protein COE77_18175 [Bacillus toyonensis]
MFGLTKIFKKKEPEYIESMMLDNSTFLDIIAPDSIQEHEDYMRLGGNYIRTLAIAHFSNDIRANFLEKLHNINANVSVVHHIEPTPVEGMIKYLDRAAVEYKSQMRDSKLKESEKSVIENRLKDTMIMIEDLTSSDGVMFNEHMLINIQAPNLKELNRITHLVKTMVSRHMKAITPNLRMVDAFNSALPLGKNMVKELTYRNFSAESLSALFPFDECELFTDKGIIKGKNLKTNSVVIVDHDALLNRNEFVVGPSGSGKSTYLWGDMMRRWEQGVKIRAVDPKGEFGHKFRKIGGTWVKISPMNDHIMNPFEIIATNIPRDENGQPIAASLLHKKISNLKTMFTLMYNDLKSQQVALALLEKAIVQTYEDFNINWDTDFTKKKPTDYPILGDLYNLIGKLIKETSEYEPLSGLYQVLYPYVEGSYSKAINGHTNVDLSNDLIDFDILDLKDDKELQKVAMYNILTFLEADAIKDLDVVQVYVDEAHILSDPRNPLAMEFLSNMYKLVRSFKGGVTSATQQIGDFLSAQEGSKNHGEAVILNSVTKLYLPMSKNELDTIMKKTSETFSEEEQKILIIKDADKEKSAGKGVYVVGSAKVSLQVELTPAELELWNYEWYKTKYKNHAKNNPQAV